MNNVSEETKKFWLNWFIEHNIRIFPLKPGEKVPSITNWDKVAKGEVTAEEIEKFKKMIIEEGYNYAVPSQTFTYQGKEYHLIILDIEKFEDALTLFGEKALNNICRNTLCVKTAHGGIHVYIFTQEEIPEHKFNPWLSKSGKTVADLQTGVAYVVAPGSCINHALCDKKKCTLEGTTRYEKYGEWNFELNPMTNLKKFFKLLVKSAKDNKIETNKKFLEWLGEKPEKEQSVSIEEFEKIKKEAHAFNKYYTVEEVKEKLCNRLKGDLRAIVCENKSYDDLEIRDRSRADFRFLRELMLHGVTDFDLLKQLLPADSKFNKNDKWKDYDKYTYIKVFKRTKPILEASRRAKIKKDREGMNQLISAIATDIVRYYNLYTVLVSTGGYESEIGIYKFDKNKGTLTPVHDRVIEQVVRKYLEPIDEAFTIFSKTRKTTVIKDIIEEIKAKRIIIINNDYIEIKTFEGKGKIENKPRVAFRNGTLEYRLSSESVKVVFIPTEERKLKHLAFNYIPHNLRIEAFTDYTSKEITVEDIENLAKSTCPRVLKLMRDWLNEKWVLGFEIIGYTLIPKYVFHKAIILYGEGKNGKSSFAELLIRILGKDNVSAVALNSLAENRFATAELYHKLANVSMETPDRLIETDNFKRLTGEDYIMAERKHKDPFYFENYAKLVIATNQLFEIKDNTEGTWRRILLVHFPNKFELQVNPVLSLDENEIEGAIVVGLVALVRVIQQRGFDYAQNTAEVRDLWLRETDNVYRFIKDLIQEGILEVGPSFNIEAKLLYRIYVEWANEKHIINYETPKTFSRKIKEFFTFEEKRMKSNITGKIEYVWYGLRLSKKGEEIYKETLDDYVEEMAQGNE